MEHDDTFMQGLLYTPHGVRFSFPILGVPSHLAVRAVRWDCNSPNIMDGQKNHPWMCFFEAVRSTKAIQHAIAHFYV